MKTTINRAALALAVALSLAACGGGDDAPPVSAASYSQSAPAGTIAVLPGQAEASASIVLLEHQVGKKISRIAVAASVSNARSSGSPTAAGIRWTLRENGAAIAQGPLSTAPALGAGGSTTHEVTVSGGSRVSIEITGHVSGAGAAVRWDAASLSLSSTPL